MKISLILLLSTFVISCYCEEKNETSSLLSVVVVFRHGERNVVETYKTDPYSNESYWKEGFGQLLNEGKIRHYLLGQWFRRRYDGFLSREYSPKYIRVESTDVDRTLMSASAHLAGLFVPSEDQIFNPSLEWQPIPIHTRDTFEDAILAAEKDCPFYEQLYNYLTEESPELEEARKEMRQVLKYISKYAGEELTTFDDILFMYDVLSVETLKGYKLPEWARRVYPEKLTKLVGIRFSLEAYNPGLARLKVGPLFNEILSHFERIINNLRDVNGNPYPKYRIYSGHDFTIANILRALGSYDNSPPPYGSALILELRKNRADKKPFINILYKNSIDAQPTKIKMTKCKFDCDFQKFERILEPITIDLKQWEIECNVTLRPNISKKSKRTWIKKELQGQIN